MRTSVGRTSFMGLRSAVELLEQGMSISYRLDDDARMLFQISLTRVIANLITRETAHLEWAISSRIDDAVADFGTKTAWACGWLSAWEDGEMLPGDEDYLRTLTTPVPPAEVFRSVFESFGVQPSRVRDLAIALEKLAEPPAAD